MREEASVPKNFNPESQPRLLVPEIGLEESCGQHDTLPGGLHDWRFQRNVVPSIRSSATGHDHHHGIIKYVSPSLAIDTDHCANNFRTVASGITTSLLLETTLLRYGRDKLAWKAAAQTAAGMSMISMLTMEMAENMVDYHLMGGAVQFDSPSFWAAALVSTIAGFLAPLPYNYYKLRKFGKACH